MTRIASKVRYPTAVFDYVTGVSLCDVWTEMLESKCPHFYELDEIFGSRHNITPPVLVEPGVVRRELQLSSPSTTTPQVQRKRPATASPNLHDALLQIHKEKSEERAKKAKLEGEIVREQLQLQKEQLQLQKDELALRVKKMDQ